jgi:hypothetical protein
MSTTDQFFPGDATLAEACKCRALAEQQAGRPATWCIVTRKGIWSPSYHFAGDETKPRDKLGRGHKEILIMGIVDNCTVTQCTGYNLFDPRIAVGSLASALG